MTEYEKWDKVIKGLECCMAENDKAWPECESCPYKDSHDSCTSMRPMFKDAIALLKASEPRLVTREDFQQPPAYDGVLPCWKENRKPTRRNGWAAIVYGKALQDMEAGVARYWTGVPTEEQRREMAWPQM